MEFRDPIIKSVVEKFVSRSNTGFKKYGVTLQDDNSPLDVWLTHLQEELMDAVNYIEKLKQASKEAFEERVIQEAKQQYEDQWKPEHDGYMLDNDEIWQ